MPPFYDQFDWSDPNTMAAMSSLAGMAGSFADSAMPSALPVPMGAVLGHAAQAMTKGAQAGAMGALDYRGKSLENTGKAVSTDQSLIIENMLRRALGKPELTAQDLAGGNTSARSPIFGLPTPQAADPTAPTPPVPQGGVPGGPPMPAAPVAPAAAPAPEQSGAQAPDAGKNGMAGALINKMLGFAPTDYQRAKLAADMLPPGPAKDEAELAAAHAAGLATSLDTRSGGMQSVLVPGQFNPDGTPVFKTIIKNPNVPEGYTLSDDGKSIVAVPGGPEAVANIAHLHAKGKAAYTPLVTYDAAGNEIIQPATALQPGDATPPATSTPTSGYAARVAQIESSGAPNPPPNGASTASGTDQFINGTWLDQAKKYLPPQLTQGKSDQDILALRSNPQVSGFLTNKYAADNAKALQSGGIKNVGAPELYLAHHFGPQGAQAILKAPVNTPLAQILPPKVMQANPDLNGATVGDVYSHSRHAMQGVQAPSAPQPQTGPAPAPGMPNTPVQNSASGIPTKLDDFLGKLGPQYQPPGRPGVPAGALMGEPGKGTEEIQKLDGDRLEGYSKEAAGGQKVYTNLQQLYQIVGRGLSTGNMTAAGTHLTNYAHQLGMDFLIPKGFDPSNAGAFNKLATDLVFAQLKQIGGRPMVSEIEGLKQANPNTSLTPEANTEILNNILADQRWRDARADLGRQYMARFGSLGDFDARFNEQYPEVDVYNRVSNAASKAGWKVPGDKASAIDPNVQKLITPEAIHATALKYGHTDAQVKAALKAKGYQVQ